jgi:hypothetical protein
VGVSFGVAAVCRRFGLFVQTKAGTTDGETAK